MTPQEQHLLTQFLERLESAKGTPQDAQAFDLIQQRLAAQPDATYLLVQRALLLELALDDARQRIQQLERQLQNPIAANSFLGRGLETHTPALNTPSTSPHTDKSEQHQPHWLKRVLNEATDAPTPTSEPPAGKKSWLGSAVTTAAEVAGGLFLWYGLDDLMGDEHDADKSQPSPTKPSSDNAPPAPTHKTQP